MLSHGSMVMARRHGSGDGLNAFSDSGVDQVDQECLEHGHSSITQNRVWVNEAGNTNSR